MDHVDPTPNLIRFVRQYRVNPSVGVCKPRPQRCPSEMADSENSWGIR
jgi:hypothetical protein